MNPNLSLFERVVRPLIGLLLILFVLSRPEFGPSEWLITLAAVFLILNGLLARCYLWRWLGINTAQNDIKLCGRSQREQS